MSTRLLSFALLASTCLASTTHAREFREIFKDFESKAGERAPDVQTAEALLRQKGGSNYSAWSKWGPRVSFQTSQTRGKDYSLFQSGSLGNFPGLSADKIQQQDLARWSLTAQLPIYNRGVHVGLEQATSDRELAETQLGIQRGQLSWKLRLSLGNFLLAAYREATSKGALETARSSLREAKVRFELGQKTKIDVLKAESNLIALEAKWLTSQQERLAQRSAFLDFSGLTSEELTESGLEGEWMQSEEKLNEAIVRFTEGSDQALKALLPYLGADAQARASRIIEKNMSYRAALSDEELAQTRASSLMAAEWPDLSASYSLSKMGTNFDKAFSSGQQTYSYGISLSVPIFSGGSMFSTHREMASAEAVARIRRARETKNLFNEIENEVLQLQTLAKSLQANTLRVSRDEEVLRLSIKSYQLGKTSTIELLGAQNDLMNSKFDLADTRIKMAVLTRQYAWNLGVELE